MRKPNIKTRDTAQPTNRNQRRPFNRGIMTCHSAKHGMLEARIVPIEDVFAHHQPHAKARWPGLSESWFAHRSNMDPCLNCSTELDVVMPEAFLIIPSFPNAQQSCVAGICPQCVNEDLVEISVRHLRKCLPGLHLKSANMS